MPVRLCSVSRWLRRSKLSGGEGLWKQFASKQFKSNAIDGLSDGEAVKLLDPRYRESLNKMLTKMNSQHQKPTNENEGGSKSVQSFYPKCKLVWFQIISIDFN